MLRSSLLVVALLASTAVAQSFALDGNKLKLPGPVIFEVGSDKLTADAAPALDHVAAYLKDKSSITLLRVEVHSDTTGNADYNQKLSEKRALAVAKALVSRGTECKRLVATGFGGTKPVAANDTPEGRAQNRRVDFVNAELRGHAIGGASSDGGGVVAGDPCG